MITGGLDTRIAAAQLDSMFGLKPIMKRRGLEVASFEDPSNLLFEYDPKADDQAQYNKYYDALSERSFRRIVSFLANADGPRSKDDINKEWPYLSADKIDKVLKNAIDLGIIYSPGADQYATVRKTNFGYTFEWYVAAACAKELESIVYWGINVKDLPSDYDVLLVRDGQLGYIECKSGKVRNISDEDLLNFFDRERRLSSQFSVFILDGVSDEKTQEMANRILTMSRDKNKGLEYDFFSPMGSGGRCQLYIEEYKTFFRIMPINCFLLTVDERSISTALVELYRFMTMVSDRNIRFENVAARKEFGYIGEHH